MAHLKIRNIGLVSSVDIELNKVNVIIGPQSSGKSTICKIACFCSWVEKKASRMQDYDFFLKDNTFYRRLVEFHKLHGYFNDKSYIEYESKTLKFSYNHAKKVPSFEWKDKQAFNMSKISYIPSERNLVSVIDNWFEVKFQDNNIRNFMIDWTDARTVHTRSTSLSIIKENNIQYYFDENNRRDIVVDNNGNILDLTNTSSGLQSIIPLKVVFEYLTKFIYQVNIGESVTDKVIEERLNKENTSLEKMTKIQYTNLFIEEPEQNIFPETQCDLLYYFLEKIQTKDDHCLFFTTHSPYILLALNNCMMGYLVKNRMPAEEQPANRNSWIDPLKVSVYEITEEGTLKPIQNKETRTIGKHYFNQIMNGIMSDYYDLLEYLDGETNEK